MTDFRDRALRDSAAKGTLSTAVPLVPTARSIVHVRHAVTAGVRLCHRSHPDRRNDSAPVSSSICRHRGCCVGVRLCRRLDDLRAHARFRQRLWRDDVFARIGDRCRRLDFRSGRSHDSVRSIEPNIRALAKVLAVAFVRQGRSLPRPRRRCRRIPGFRFCAAHAVIAAAGRCVGTTARSRHGHTGAGNFRKPRRRVADARFRSRPRPFSAPIGSTSRCSACHWRFSSPRLAPSLPGGSR